MIAAIYLKLDHKKRARQYTVFCQILLILKTSYNNFMRKKIDFMWKTKAV